MMFINILFLKELSINDGVLKRKASDDKLE